MNKKELAQSETRTVVEYLNAKLNMSVEYFANLEGCDRRTVYDRWQSKAGKVRVMDAVLRIYIRRFDHL